MRGPVDGNLVPVTIIWFPAEHYTLAYNVPNDWWKEFLLLEGYKVPGINTT